MAVTTQGSSGEGEGRAGVAAAHAPPAGPPRPPHPPQSSDARGTPDRAPARMSVREVAIVQLLERYEDLVDPQQIRAGGDRDGFGALMPGTYTGSVRELERLVVRLREERHHLWWHLNERYLACEWRTCWRCPRCKGETHAQRHRHRDRRGRMSNYDGVRILKPFWSERVNPAKVRAALSWLAGEWSLEHEPMLPRAELDPDVKRRKQQVAA